MPLQHRVKLLKPVLWVSTLSYPPHFICAKYIIPYSDVLDKVVKKHQKNRHLGGLSLGGDGGNRTLVLKLSYGGTTRLV